MELEDLRTFVEVADTGGVASAARRLGLSKSIVSRHVSRLEDALGTQLLARTARGSTLTEAGATFREHALRIVAEIETACETLSPEGEVRGLLRVAAPLSFGITKLPPVFAELAKRHPLLHLDTAYSDRFVDIVGEGFDCAIRLGALPVSSLVAKRIFTFQARMVASPGYLAARGVPKTMDDLADHEIVARKGEVWPLRDGEKSVSFRPHGRFTVDNGEAVLAAVLAGVGVAGLPDFLVDGHIAAGRLVPVMADYVIADLGMYVVRPPGSFPVRKVRALIDILTEYFGRTSSGKPAIAEGR